MVEIGDWVQIKDTAGGYLTEVHDKPLQVTYVDQTGSVDVAVTDDAGCGYFYRDEYDVVTRKGDRSLTTKAAVLESAIELITGDREADYGEARKNFTDIAALWSVVLGVEVKAWQVAACMDQLKLARAIKTPTHRDSWVDKAGYTGLAAELALNEPTHNEN